MTPPTMTRDAVKLGFGRLPAGVTEGGTAESTVSITDDDYPQITVSFRLATYTVNEGFSVQVDIDLSADPEREILIPLTRMFLGGAIEGDLDEPPTAVHVPDGNVEGAISFRTAGDTIADHGESVRLSFGDLPAGVTASGTTTATVTIIDDDPAVDVEFGATAYSVEEGASVIVTVTLSDDPKRPLTIPISATAQGTTSTDDYTDPTSVTFASGQTSRTFSFSVTEDTTADSGESVMLFFGSLPPGVSPGTDGEAIVTIIDDDPPVRVSFGAATYSIEEGESVDVTVTLSADPQRTVTIPITTTNQSGATSADYTDVTSVTFNSGDTSKTISFSTTEDTIDDDDEKVRLAFGTYPPGVSAGATTSTTVSINDDDDPDVQVFFGAHTYNVTEGQGGIAGRVRVEMSPKPERMVTIPLTVTLEGGSSSADYSGVPASVTFGPNDISKTFTVIVVDDDIDDDGESLKITFGDLPSRVTTGLTFEATFNLNDNDTRGVTITPTALTIVELEWDDYTVVLDTEPTGEVTVTITDPTDSTDVEVPTGTLTFTTDNWDMEQTVRVNVGGDYVDEADGTGTITHSASGGDYGTVTVDGVVVTVEDDDETPVITGSATKNFPEFEFDGDKDAFDKTVATYSATDGDTNPETTTWDISGTDASKFTITEDDGVLSFDSEPDFENPTDGGFGNTYEVTVEASDGTNTGTFSVVVTVTNVNETPDLKRAINPANELSLDEKPYHETVSPIRRIVAQFLAIDEEMQSLTWSLRGTDAGDFKIEDHPTLNNYSRLSFRNPWDYENPTDADEDNVYEITVRASDGTNTGTFDFTLTVTDLNERPDINEVTGDKLPDYMEIEFDSTATPGNVHTFSATDYDEDDTFTWSVEGDDADSFEIGSSTGVVDLQAGLGFRPPAGLRGTHGHGRQQRLRDNREGDGRRFHTVELDLRRHREGDQRQRNAGIHGDARDRHLLRREEDGVRGGLQRPRRGGSGHVVADGHGQGRLCHQHGRHRHFCRHTQLRGR